VAFKFEGNLTDYVALHMKKVGVALHMKKVGVNTFSANSIENQYRGQAGFILGQYGPSQIKDANILSLAKARLNKFSVILLTEEMEATGRMFEIKFGWDTSMFGKNFVNSNGNQTNLLEMIHSISPEERSFVRKYAAVDIQLYHYARHLVDTMFRLHNAPAPFPHYQFSAIDNAFLE
jgi:hypothetical protein